MKHRTARELHRELSLTILAIIIGAALMLPRPNFAVLIWACTWAYAICLGILTIFGDFGESKR
jgi:hypothetical protein|tara:strand:- start:2944 stop:3132 length:189 start_codon:yes stop_codon:yes gene_type:complete